MIKTIDNSITPIKNKNAVQNLKKKASKVNTMIPTANRKISSWWMSNDVDKIKPKVLKLNGSLDDEWIIEIVNRSK